MFHHLACFYPSRRYLVQLCLRPVLFANTRGISSTSSPLSDLAPEPPSEVERARLRAFQPHEERFEQAQDETAIREPETYNQFMQTMGPKFKLATDAKQWLGGDVPFPMNPSFKPPPPVSDELRQLIYDSYMKNPESNSVRSLSQRLNLSLKRVDAILRLKGMERDWKQGKILQLGFRNGMEKLLGVVQRRTPHLAFIEPDETRRDADEADSLEEAEKRDAARQRYQQLYWESVPEDGREPIVPASLEYAKAAAKRFARAQEAYKSTRKLMPNVKDATTQRPKTKMQIVEKPGRPTLKFVDVGGHFIDVDERLRRITESERRASRRGKRATMRELLRKRNNHARTTSPTKDSTL